MLIEEFLSLEVFIMRDHDIIEIAIRDLEVIEAADVSLGGDLRANCNIGHCC